MDGLTRYGWNDWFASQAATHDSDLLPARVAVCYGHRFVCLGADREYSAEISGSLSRELAAASAFPVTGDWILLEPLRGASGDPELAGDGRARALARALLRRKTDFARKAPISGGRRLETFEGETVLGGGRTVSQSLAANVDRVFVVNAVGPGSLARTVERYLVVVRASGAEPVVVLNKADLADGLDSELAALRAVARGVRVIATSALRGDGIAELLSLAGLGVTVALIGKSGVGKSALVNALLGEERQSTGAISGAVGKGKHTTTTRELVQLPGGGILVDTPGMREFQLWGDGDILSGEFDDVEALASGCRFSDCRHHGEPGCAVAAALEDGSLERGRWDGYEKLRRELALLSIRKEQRARVVDIEASVEASRRASRRESLVNGKSHHRAIEKGARGRIQPDDAE